MKRTRDADGFTERFKELLEQYGSKNIEAAKKIVNKSYRDGGGYQGRLNTAVAREHEQTGFTLDKLHKRLDDISDYGVPIDNGLIIGLFDRTPAFDAALDNSKAKRAAPEFTTRFKALLKESNMNIYTVDYNYNVSGTGQEKYYALLNIAVANKGQKGITIEKLHKRLDDIRERGVPIDNGLISTLFLSSPEFKAALDNSTAKAVKEINGLLRDLRNTIQEISPFAPEAGETLYTSQHFAPYIQRLSKYKDSFEVGVSLSGKEIEFVGGVLSKPEFLGKVESPSKLIKDLQRAKNQVIDLAVNAIEKKDTRQGATKKHERLKLICDLKELMGPDTKFGDETIADKVNMLVFKYRDKDDSDQLSAKEDITPANLKDRIAQIKDLGHDRGKQQEVAQYLFKSKADFDQAIEDKGHYSSPFPAQRTGPGS